MNGTASLSSFAYAQQSGASATLAANWASQTSGTVDGTHYSAYYWAQQAALSASQAAGAGVSPTGTFTVGHLLVAAKGDGTQIKDLGAPAAVATSGSASDLTTGTLPSAQAPVLSGDITTSAGSGVATIAANAVTNAKAAQMAAGTVKANITGATANATDSTLSAILDTLLGSTVGNVAMRGSSGWTAAPPVVSYPVTGTSAKSAAYTLGSTAGDTGKVFVLTGSFPLTLPAASGGSTTSALYFHYYKRDGSGACTLVLSGSDTWDDGTTAAKFVYQETGTLVSIGGGVWRFAPGTRQRGKVFAGTYIVASGAAAVNIPLGFGDPDAVNVLLDIFNFLQSGTSGGQLTLSLAQGGSTATLSSSVSVSSASNTTRNAGALTLRNVSATAAYMTTVQAAYSNTTTSVTSAGAITSATLTPGSGPISSMTYNVWVDRS